MDQPTETGEALVSAQVPFYTKSVWKARSTVYFRAYSVDVELNSDPEDQTKHKTVVCCAQGQKRTAGDSELLKCKMDMKQDYSTSVMGH